MSCIMRGNACDECPMNQQCAYSVIFESPVPRNNPYLAGRNRYPHPFTLYCKTTGRAPARRVDLSLTLIGRAIPYFPYLYFALKEAGAAGVFRERTPYKIQDVTVNKESIVENPEKLKTDIAPFKWTLTEPSETLEHCNLKINFISPFRLKIGGSYSVKFSYREFLESLKRRLTLLYQSYGTEQGIIPTLPPIPEKRTTLLIHWEDYPRYSARQKTSLRLGGVVGSMEVAGNFSAIEKSFLTGSAIFHAGKNTAFGFGKIGLTGL